MAIAVAAITLLALVLDVAPALAWVIVGITVAIALDPLVDWIAGRTPLGPGASISAVIVALCALVIAILLFASGSC